MFSLISGLPSSLSANGFPFCSNDSSVLCRCPTPRRRARGSYGYRLLPPACRMIRGRHLRGLPVLVHEVSRRAWGLRLRRADRAARVIAPGHVAFRQCDSVGALIATFRSSIPSPPIPLFTLHWAPRGAQRKTRGRVDRYSFLVRLLHPLLHAGLASVNCEYRPMFRGCVKAAAPARYDDVRSDGGGCVSLQATLVGCHHSRSLRPVLSL